MKDQSTPLADGFTPGRSVIQDIELLSEIQRLLDRISKEDEDSRILGYARQIRALMRGEVFDRAVQ